MSSLKEVYWFVGGWQQAVDIFGASPDFREGFAKRAECLGEAIAREQGVTLDEATKLPYNIQLGKEAQLEFHKFQEWVRRNR